MVRQPVKSVLLVEDNDDQRTNLARLFRLSGWAVEVAVDGVEGLRHLAAHRPDVIVTDYMMPAIDGFEMITRADHDLGIRGIPVVVVTAAVNVPSALTARAAATLSKPTSFADLDELLHRLVDRADPPPLR